MPKLIFKEFIDVYKKNPQEALRLVTSEENDVDFFESAKEFILLGNLYKQEIRDFASRSIVVGVQSERIEKIQHMRDVLGILFDRLSDKLTGFFCSDFAQYLEISIISYSIACKIYDKQPEQVYALVKTHRDFLQLAMASDDAAKKFLQQEQESETFRIRKFFATHQQFMELHSTSSSVADEIFRVEPNRIGSLFTTREQFLELCIREYSMARQVCHNEPIRIGSCFINCEQFLELHSHDTSIAREIFNNNLPRMKSIFASYTQFMRLAAEDSALANNLFEQDPAAIVALFNSEEKLEQLSNTSTSLTRKIRPLCNFISPQPGSLSTKNIHGTRSASFFSVPTVDDDFNPLYSSDNPNSNAPKSNHFFKLQCFAMLTVGGIALLLLGNLMLLPDIALAGGIITVVGLYGLYDSLTQPTTPESASEFSFNF